MCRREAKSLRLVNPVPTQSCCRLGLPDGSLGANVQRMANTTHITPSQVVTALRDALASAMDNLPDVAGDPFFGPQDTAECCADIAALHHLLKPDAGGEPNVLAYL